MSTTPILFYGPHDHLVRCPVRWLNDARCRRTTHDPDGPHLFDLTRPDDEETPSC